MASNKKQFLLRVDPALWAELETLAAQQLRSVNGQIEYMLRESLARQRRKPLSEGEQTPDPEHS